VRAQGLVAAGQVASMGFPVRVPYNDPKFTVLSAALGTEGRAALVTLSASSSNIHENKNNSSGSSSKKSLFGNLLGSSTSSNSSSKSNNTNSNTLVNPPADMAALLWAFNIDSSQFRVGNTAVYFRSHIDAVAVFHQLLAHLQAANNDSDDESASSTLVTKISEAGAVQHEAKGGEETVQALFLNARTELEKAQDLSRSSAEAVTTNNQKLVNAKKRQP
jgi:hypothetical protein